MDFTIIISPRRARDKRAAQSVYDARLIGEEELLCSSNTVFLDAARQLLRSGRADPDDELIMQHIGSSTEAPASQDRCRRETHNRGAGRWRARHTFRSLEADGRSADKARRQAS
jgi:hypothetical protein